MKKKEQSDLVEEQEFTLLVDEFLNELGTANAELKAAFKALTVSEKITGHKMRSEWDRLLLLFRSQPTKLTWSEWITQQEGGN